MASLARTFFTNHPIDAPEFPILYDILPLQKGAQSLALVNRCISSAVLRLLTTQNYTSYRLSVTIPSKSCPSTSMCYLLSHGSCPRELLPPGSAPSPQQRHRTQLPHLRLPPLDISNPSFQKAPVAWCTQRHSHISLWILERETDDHSLCSLQCVGLLLILLMKYLARESASIYVFSPIIKKTVSRRTFGLPLTSNGTTPISVREVPCA